MQNGADTSANNLAGGGWLLADMALNIWALAIVKALGLGYGPAQIVFLRACVGMLIVLPWAVQSWRVFGRVDRIRLHGLRVVFSSLALSASFLRFRACRLHW